MIDTIPLLVLVAAFAVGGFAQGATGIGFALVSAPVCAVVLDPDEVVGTVVRLALVMDVTLAVRAWRAIDVRVASTYLAAALVATPFAVVAAAVAPAGLLVVGLAVLTLVGAAALLVATPLRAGAVAAPSLGPQVVAGFASGFMGVTTGMPGPPVALESARRHVSPARTRATLAVFFACVDLVASIANPHSLRAGPMVVLGVAGVLGLLVAGPVARHIDPVRARRLVAAVVIASALVALVRQTR